MRVDVDVEVEVEVNAVVQQKHSIDIIISYR